MHSQMLRLRGYDLLKSWEPHVRKREVRCIYVRWAIDAVLAQFVQTSWGLLLMVL